jgi:hypothetical protein
MTIKKCSSPLKQQTVLNCSSNGGPSTAELFSKVARFVRKGQICSIIKAATLNRLVQGFEIARVKMANLFCKII